ncbi:hypothetical protein PUO95_09410 [Xylella fastidiosa subsp. fastidiosa]|uniref:hypothetical protein n=2 Tax=Xylella fastidiosa TaxID=2371 RepID=UPI001427FE38|nr:hypothetical protein [Xylella fastidiosa]NMR13894.1 hypothetical protein [Xylella fastidiosa]QIS26427.1 hypothetical protein F7G16_09865 [Xylella fastidiosa]WCF22969.1 hypothetical protein OK113_05890 [Xylella fastidiosa subsp. fastidiosa]WDF00376.1 hypothetical protein PUO95_09410 [Xylella fastidiosa subsp. fastidiosa]
MRCDDNGQHIDTEHPTHERKKPMFPITVTITDQAQLNAVLAVLNPPRSTSSPAQPVLDTTPRSDSAPSPPPAAPPPPTDVAQPAANPAAAQSTTDAMSTPGYLEAAKALTALSKELGNTYAKDVLTSFGVAGLSQIPPELYPTLMERIEGFYIAHERGLPLEAET